MAQTVPIQIAISDRPRSVIASMDKLLQQSERSGEIVKRRKWLPLLFLLGGVPFLFVDFFLKIAFGYNACMFIFITVVLWIAAVVTFIALRRARVQEFPPHYHTARNVINTLRDDIARKRELFGHLDLTGAQQESKLASETPNALGLVVQRFRDDWLVMKAKLYDGNMLRMSAVERIKVRKGYWKRGSISGKRKWKAPKVKYDKQQLRVRLSVNPDVYEIVPDGSLEPQTQLGPYVIDELNIDRSSTSGGIVSLSASTNAATIAEADILGVLKAVYSLLKRKE